jgi:hypothetical protein
MHLPFTIVKPVPHPARTVIVKLSCCGMGASGMACAEDTTAKTSPAVANFSMIFSLGIFSFAFANMGTKMDAHGICTVSLRHPSGLPAITPSLFGAWRLHLKFSSG